MEGVQGHLGRGLTDGLPGDGSHVFTWMRHRFHVLKVVHLFKGLALDGEVPSLRGLIALFFSLCVLWVIFYVGLELVINLLGNSAEVPQGVIFRDGWVASVIFHNLSLCQRRIIFLDSFHGLPDLMFVSLCLISVDTRHNISRVVICNQTCKVLL